MHYRLLHSLLVDAGRLHILLFFFRRSPSHRQDLVDEFTQAFRRLSLHFTEGESENVQILASINDPRRPSLSVVPVSQIEATYLKSKTNSTHVHQHL